MGKVVDVLKDVEIVCKLNDKKIKISECDNCEHLYTCDNNWCDDNCNKCMNEYICKG